MKIEIEEIELNEIMEFVSELSHKMNMHSIHYMVSSCISSSQEDKIAYEFLRKDKQDVWRIWELLRDLKRGKPETEKVGEKE